MAEHEPTKARRRLTAKAQNGGGDKKRKCNFVCDARLYMRLGVAATDLRRSKGEVIEDALLAFLVPWNVRLAKDSVGETEAAA